MLRDDKFLFVCAVTDLQLLLCLLNHLLTLEQRLNKTLPVLSEGLHVEVVFGPRGLVGIGDGEGKAVDIESFALVELVFGVDE